jgi:hypothetical protein
LQICTIPFSHEKPKLVSDLAGGAIVVWSSLRLETEWYDIYAQRVDAVGDTVWTENGIPVCEALNGQYFPEIVTDGVGGAIIVWDDERTGGDIDVYAQRIDATGNVIWDLDGIAICTAAQDQTDIQISPDGFGGAIFVWSDYRITGTSSDIYAQRVNADGDTLWDAGGVVVCAAPDSQCVAKIVGDGSGGGIIVWRDYRHRSSTSEDLYAQRLDPDGIGVWAQNGVPVVTGPMQQDEQQVVSDGKGGAIVTWWSVPSGGNIRAQRLDQDGNALWGADGVFVCEALENQWAPQILSDGSSGAVFCWIDYRNGTADIYASRLDSSGSDLWTTGGIPVVIAASVQTRAQMSSDGQGGTIIVWEDNREQPFSPDIYAQRLDSAGNPLWAINGIPVSTAPAHQMWPQITPDSLGGAIITWEDWRQGGLEGYYYVYAQRVGPDGTLGDPTGVVFNPTARVSLEQNFPNPFNPETRIRFTIPANIEVELNVYDTTGRLVKNLFAKDVTVGRHIVHWDGTDNAGESVASGVYFYRLVAGNHSVSKKMVLLR